MISILLSILAFSSQTALAGSQPLLLLYYNYCNSPISSDHYDTRCSCKCPDAESIFEQGEINIAYPNRKVYINSMVNASECTCENVVMPLLMLNDEQVEKFCPRCNCQHETRSVITIKVVVGLIIWILSLLLIYLVYLVFVDPVFRLGKRESDSV